jgi:Polysaccharide lyase
MAVISKTLVKNFSAFKLETAVAIFAKAILLGLLLLWPKLTDAQVLWSADHETGDMSQWYQGDSCGGEFNSGISNSEVSTDVALSGSYSAKATIRTPNYPESGVRLFRWCEPRDNTDTYYSAWYFFPQNYIAPNWWNVWQWKSHTPTLSDPFFLLNIDNRVDDSMYIYLYDWQRKQSYGQSTFNLPVGRWVQLEGYLHCAADSSGRVMIWQDGQLLFDVSGLTTRYSDGDCEWSIDNYSDLVDPDPTTIYFDDAAIGLSRIGPPYR